MRTSPTISMTLFVHLKRMGNPCLARDTERKNGTMPLATYDARLKGNAGQGTPEVDPDQCNNPLKPSFGMELHTEGNSN